MSFKIVPCYDVCPDTDSCDDPYTICKREGFFLYDTASDLWFDGETWAPEKEKAKRFKIYTDASIAAEKERERQKNVVAELSKKFGK